MSQKYLRSMNLKMLVKNQKNQLYSHKILLLRMNIFSWQKLVLDSKLIVFLILMFSFNITESVFGQTIKYQQIEQNQATKTAIFTSVYPGRVTTIDFSPVKQTITYIGLGDASRIVYNTDSPINNGMAQTLFLRPIQPLNFPGTTKAKITNLIVKTIDLNKVPHLYNFQIIQSTGTATNLGVQIVKSNHSLSSTQINLGNGRTATINDIYIGLQRAISRGYTSPNDPVVKQVRQFLAIAQNQDFNELSLPEIAKQIGLDFAIVVELGKISFENISR